MEPLLRLTRRSSSNGGSNGGTNNGSSNAFNHHHGGHPLQQQQARRRALWRVGTGLAAGLAFGGLLGLGLRATVVGNVVGWVRLCMAPSLGLGGT